MVKAILNGAIFAGEMEEAWIRRFLALRMQFIAKGKRGKRQKNANIKVKNRFGKKLVRAKPSEQKEIHKRTTFATIWNG